MAVTLAKLAAIAIQPGDRSGASSVISESWTAIRPMDRIADGGCYSRDRWNTAASNSLPACVLRRMLAYVGWLPFGSLVFAQPSTLLG